jgi:hypothetical protein
LDRELDKKIRDAHRLEERRQTGPASRPWAEIGGVRAAAAGNHHNR